MQTEEITSTQNPKIKQIVALIEKSRERHSSNLFVVEGVREVTDCLCNNYIAEALYFAPEIAGAEMERLPQLAATLQRLPYRPKVFSLQRRLCQSCLQRGHRGGACSSASAQPYTAGALPSALWHICRRIFSKICLNRRGASAAHTCLRGHREARQHWRNAKNSRCLRHRCANIMQLPMRPLQPQSYPRQPGLSLYPESNLLHQQRGWRVAA